MILMTVGELLERVCEYTRVAIKNVSGELMCYYDGHNSIDEGCDLLPIVDFTVYNGEVEVIVEV